jgi:5-methylcytosine-specific restriction endonuclease McrA
MTGAERIYEALMNDEPIPWEAKLDPKPPKRIKADQNEWQRLRTAKLVGRSCRTCELFADLQLHHLVPRGMGGTIGGDDIEANLVALCSTCHGLVEARDPWACSLLGRRLTDAEREYVLEKKGAVYLEKRYGLKEKAA